MKLPFGFLPAHWGLKGKLREEAKIIYEINDPYLQEKSLLELNHKYSTNDEKSLKLSFLDLDKKFNKFKNDYDYQEARINLLHDDQTEKERALLKLKFENEKISELDYERELSLIDKQPWVGVKKSSYDPKEGLGGLEFELDWNEYFITFLTENGYKGLSDQQIVENWFNDLCKSVVAEEGLEEYIAALETGTIVQSSNGITKKDIDGDRTEFS